MDGVFALRLAAQYGLPFDIPGNDELSGVPPHKTFAGLLIMMMLGLKLGADDYLAKPFLLEELMLRIQGIFRRQDWYATPPEQQEVFRFGDSEVNFRTYEAVAKGRTVQLTEKECMLIKLLVERRNQVVSREEILERVWGYRFSTSSRTIDNFIVRLRRYFESDPRRPAFVQSVRGVGYRLSIEAE